MSYAYVIYMQNSPMTGTVAKSPFATLRYPLKLCNFLLPVTYQGQVCLRTPKLSEGQGIKFFSHIAFPVAQQVSAGRPIFCSCAGSVPGSEWLGQTAGSSAKNLRLR